jgi:hypothetical protein
MRISVDSKIIFEVWKLFYLQFEQSLLFTVVYMISRLCIHTWNILGSQCADIFLGSRHVLNGS